MPSPELLAKLGELSDLRHAGLLLMWDQQVTMPPAGAAARGPVMGTLETLAHDRLVAPELGALLDAERDGDDPQIVRAVRRERDIACRVPSELATEMALAGSEGFETWLRAREANDYSIFEPALRRNVELARRYAGCFPDNEHPYDALLDRFEPSTTAAQVSALFMRLRGGLVPLLAEIAEQPAPAPLSGTFPTDAQREVGLQIVRVMGFEDSAWRLDDAVHPFAASPSLADVRVTSRFEEHSLTGLFALMHEVGHGLYERNIDPALARTTLDTGVSLGVHESQSRLWENLVGRSEPFWSFWLPKLRERMPETLDGVQAVRQLVRLDADPRRGGRADVLPARDRPLRARAGAGRGHARHRRPAAGVGREDAGAARHRRPRRPARGAAGRALVGGDHRLLPDLRDRQRARRAAVEPAARRPAEPRRRPASRRPERARHVAEGQDPPPWLSTDARGAHRAGGRGTAGPRSDARAPQREVPRAVRPARLICAWTFVLPHTSSD